VATMALRERAVLPITVLSSPNAVRRPAAARERHVRNSCCGNRRTGVEIAE
jgi:hypothetical protein